MQIGRLVVRGVIRSLFIGHGAQKLFGWFGGRGVEGTRGMMDALEMRPTKPNALAAGVAETAGGALLAAGLATPLAAASLIGTMVTAVRKVHLSNGVWAANGGWEYNAVLVAALVGLAEDGAGDLSLDAKLGIEEHGAVWAIGALALGVAASTVAIELGRRGGGATPGSPVGASPVGDPPAADRPDTTDVAGDPVTER